jgi:hypothetical protein
VGAWIGHVAGATAIAKRILGVSGVSEVQIPPLTRRKEGSLFIHMGSAGREKTPRTPKPPRERRLTRPTVVRILVRACVPVRVRAACVLGSDSDENFWPPGACAGPEAKLAVLGRCRCDDTEDDRVEDADNGVDADC